MMLADPKQQDCLEVVVMRVAWYCFLGSKRSEPLPVGDSFKRPMKKNSYYTRQNDVARLQPLRQFSLRLEESSTVLFC